MFDVLGKRTVSERQANLDQLANLPTIGQDRPLR